MTEVELFIVAMFTIGILFMIIGIMKSGRMDY